MWPGSPARAQSPGRGAETEEIEGLTTRQHAGKSTSPEPSKIQAELGSPSSPCFSRPDRGRRHPHSFARGTMTRHAAGSMVGLERDRSGLTSDRGGSSDRLDPFLGVLPPDVLKEVLLPKLDYLSRALFARASGACWRAMKDVEMPCSLERDTCEKAAKEGHLSCLRYAREDGCPWDVNTCWAAAEGGHLECLRYAREDGCPWDWVTCWATAEGRHLECLQYAHENGCE
jgi:hypothetical protein